MMNQRTLLWLILAITPVFTTGCPVDVNEGGDGEGDDPTPPECDASMLSTVRIVHAAGGTPVTRRPGVTTTRNLNIFRVDLPDSPPIASLVAGRAALVQICGNKPITLGARLAGAAANRVTMMTTLTRDTDPSLFDAGVTIVVAGISDALKPDGSPENPKSVADPLRFIVIPDEFGTGAETQIQVVHASRRTPATVDVEANPDRMGVEITALARYAVSAPEATRGSAHAMPSAVPVVFLDATATRASFSIAPRLPTSAKALAIHFDTEVFDPDNPDPTMVSPPPVPRLFVTGDDPLLGFVAGGGITF